MIKKMNNRGDTIVEVLIAIAVVSSVLAIAYSIMSRSIATMRSNQERTEASKIAQAQLEFLKGRLQDNPNQVTPLGASDPFCINIDTGILDTVSATIPAADPATESVAAYETCVSTFYRYVIRRDTDVDFTYTITVRWDEIRGATSQVVMVYRVPTPL